MNASTRLTFVFGMLALLALAAPPQVLAEDAGPPTDGLLLAQDQRESCHLAPLANLTYFWNRFQQFLFNTFRSRERMIQLTLIGVLVGLFIMLRRMPGKE